MNFDFEQNRKQHAHFQQLTMSSQHYLHQQQQQQTLSAGRRIRMAKRGTSLDAELAVSSTGASLDGGLDIVDSNDDLLYTIRLGRNLSQLDPGTKFRAVSSLSENGQQLQVNGGNGATPGRNTSTLPTNLRMISANGTSKSANSFRFSTDEISQFRAELGSSVGDLGYGRNGGCSTRATTPGEEQLFQEPVESLQVRIGRLLSSEEMADMHFLVGGIGSATPGAGPASSSSPINRKLRIPAHRIIMAATSNYFRELLLDPATNRLRDLDDRGNQGEGAGIEIPDIDAGSFLEFLRFAYTDTARLSKDNAVGVLVCARRYEVTCLEQQSIQFIHRCLAKRSALAIWAAARHYGDTELEHVARRSVQHFADGALLSNDFLKLDQAAIYEILSDDALRADEIVVFRALTRWAKQHCLKAGLCPNRANVRSVLGNGLNLVRFPLMTEEQLQRIVAAEGVLEDELLRALVHCSRSWSKMPSNCQPPVAFSSDPRTFQKLKGRLMSVYRFAAFEGTATNRSTTRSLNFLTNRRVLLAGVGLYAPRKACTFYLNVWVRVRRADHGTRVWASPLDRIEQTVLLKFDGSDHIINVHFDDPLQIEANVQYVIESSITPTTRSTSLVKARLHPHLYYTRPADVNFYYGTEGQYATKVRIGQDNDSTSTSTNHRPENVIFNFDWERETSAFGANDDSSDSFSSNNVIQCFGGGGGGGASSEPTTPAPPPRPPPPQEYRRPSRMQRLRRAFSFIDRRDDSVESASRLVNGLGTEPSGNETAQKSTKSDSALFEGQIPLLMFYA